MYQIQNERGSILLNKNIISNIVMDVIARYEGKVLLCNQKSKIFSKEPKGSYMMDIVLNNDEFTIKFYVVIRLGNSINSITNSILDELYSDIQCTLGIKPQKITVVVAGILSKQLAKRNIEVTR